MKHWATAVIVIWFTIASVPSHLRWMISEHWYDPEQKLVTIRLDEDIDASDADCQKAAELFHAICLQGYTLKVLPYKTGGWVPSKINPMTVRWTNILTGQQSIDPPDP